MLNLTVNILSPFFRDITEQARKESSSKQGEVNCAVEISNGLVRKKDKR